MVTVSLSSAEASGPVAYPSVVPRVSLSEWFFSSRLDIELQGAAADHGFRFERAPVLLERVLGAAAVAVIVEGRVVAGAQQPGGHPGPRAGRFVAVRVLSAGGVDLGGLLGRAADGDVPLLLVGMAGVASIVARTGVVREMTVVCRLLVVGAVGDLRRVSEVALLVAGDIADRPVGGCAGSWASRSIEFNVVVAARTAAMTYRLLDEPSGVEPSSVVLMALAAYTSPG